MVVVHERLPYINYFFMITLVYILLSIFFVLVSIYFIHYFITEVSDSYTDILFWILALFYLILLIICGIFLTNFFYDQFL